MAAEETRPGGPRGWLTPGRIVVLVLAALALVFVFENTKDIRIRLLVPEVTMPLWLALLIPYAVGWLVGRFLGPSRRR
ncbi:MAG TPA: DUF1049 domain-containing protein [Trebonia sp.]|nr:DUF1049 domain-containing protein [Trebonia sp.]